MKKGLLLLVLFVFAPVCYAEISIDGPDKTVYNLGDEVILNGYILRNEAFDGSLKLTLDCSSGIYELPSVALTLNKNEKKDFGSEIKLPRITIGSSVGEGICSIEMSLVSVAEKVESVKSKEFSVKKELKGNFAINNNKIQMGNSFRLTGNIYKLDGTDTNGVVEIYFKKDPNRFMVDSTDTKDGRIDYEYSAIQVPQGIYKIDLEVKDLYGNEMTFQDVAEVNIVSKLSITAKASKTLMGPGESFKVYGEVKSLVGDDTIEGNAEIKLDDNEYIALLKNNKFEYRIELSKKVKSGKHVVKIAIKDKNGNMGYDEVQVEVEPVQARLGLKLSSEKIMPRETLEITPLLYDQAGDLIMEELSIEVHDINDKLVFSDAVTSNSASKFEIPWDAEPGVYSIRLSSTELKSKASFEIGVVDDADVFFANQSIFIKNIGNSNFDEIVKAEVMPGNTIIIKDVSIAPDETYEIKLDKELKNSGTYNAIVYYGSKTKEFKEMMITASRRLELTMLYYAIGGILLVMFAYTMYLKTKVFGKSRMKEQHDALMAKKDLKRIREMKSKGDGSKGYRFSHKNIDRKQALDDFKKSYVDKVKEPEQRDGMFGFMDK